jgi:hypothetical protein
MYGSEDYYLQKSKVVKPNKPRRDYLEAFSTIFGTNSSWALIVVVLASLERYNN